MIESKLSVFAHRGGTEWAPENTLAAFTNCLELGVDGIVLDVQPCASGELVVIHDDDLGRTTNGGGLVADATLEEIQRLSAGLWFDREFAAEKVPTLAQVLDLVAGQCLLEIRLLAPSLQSADATINLLDALDPSALLELLDGYCAPQKIIVSSFDHSLVAALSNHLRGAEPLIAISRALLIEGLLVNLEEYVGLIGAGYYHPAFRSLRADVVSRAHQADLRVNAWTLNNRIQWLSAIKMGVDGIVTDDPEGLMIFLKRALPAGAVSPLS